MLFVDFLTNITSDIFSDLIKDRIKKKQIQNSILNYIDNKKDENGRYSIQSEYDYAGFYEFCRDCLLDDIREYITSQGEDKETVKKRIKQKAINASNTKYNLASNNISRYIEDLLTLVYSIYRESADIELRLLTGEIEEGIHESEKRIVSEIQSIKDTFSISQDIIANEEIVALIATRNSTTKQKTCETKSQVTGDGSTQVSETCVFTSNVVKRELWEASKVRYIASHREGGRFHKLDIIERLLPQGYISKPNFLSLGKMEDGTEVPLVNLCARAQSDIAIVGDGGIGKTTFLQHLMAEEFFLNDNQERSYSENRPVPFFIELNRCPDHVGDWFDDSLRKTNFITRYIGQIKENHSTLDSVSPDTLLTIEKEMQKVPVDGQPQYLLLLDGFNEVRASHMIRTFLSNEISVLHSCSNVRIITTSRETTAAYYALDFENVRLAGVKEEDVVAHLEKSGIPQPVIGEIKNCDSLMKCLRVPLYLCMFSAEQGLQDNYIPETAGEILYSFFHRNSAFYNVRSRINETRTIELTGRQITLVLDFVLPFIGWIFEENDTFHMNEREFMETISNALHHIRIMLTFSEINPFADFDYSGTILKETIESFFEQDGTVNTFSIVSCVYDYLGIIYRDQVNEGAFADRIRYAFCHHHFRDYFSPLWDVRLLSMMQCIPVDAFSGQPNEPESCSFRHFLDERYWKTQKVSFISEILMEHRNRPQLDNNSKNWFLPRPKYDEERVLTGALDYCKELNKSHVKTEHILQNVLGAILYGRKEYSGLDLSDLDLQKCRLFNVTCSRRGKTKSLTTTFDRSMFSHKSFEPEDHQNSVMEYIYHEKQCFTIDDGGAIKCWDMLSGRLEYELHSADPLGVTDFSSKGFFKISRNGRWLAAKVQETYDGGIHVYINVFDLLNPGSPPRRISPTEEHNLLTYFAFTEDSASILMLCDRTVIYCMDVETGKKCYSGAFALYKQSELYADSADSDIYVYTAEYDTYETDHELMRSWVNNNDEEDEDWDFSSDENELPGEILCELRVIKPQSSIVYILYTFLGEPGTAPTVSYFAHNKYFLLYNYERNHIERFDCISKQVEIVLRELTEEQDTSPTEIHPHLERHDGCFIMYPNVCFDVDVRPGSGGNILMTYSISGVEKLLPDSDQSGELEFKTSVIPTMNRFVVGNDTNTYEWDAENDVVIRKYNSIFYECTELFSNAAKDRCILVHRHNGISFFKGTPPIFYYQHCFQEPGYVADISCFDDTHDVLAMVLARPDHEKVLILDITTGKEHTVFSSLFLGETIENLCFSDDGNRLLITSQYRCMECNLLQGKILTEVACAGRNERFAAGNYRGEEIEIAVVEHIKNAEPHVDPSCVYYRRSEKDDDPSFLRTWCYLMPELKKEQFRYFVYRDGDLGVGGANDCNGFQTYWVTSGFFLEMLPDLAKIFKPICYTWREDHKIKIEKEFQVLDEIFVWHKHEITNRYRVGDSGFSYMFLADDKSEAVITNNRVCLSYQNDLKNLTYKRLQDNLQSILKSVHEGTYWDYTIPWCDGNLIGCFEGYCLASVSVLDNQLLDSIEYYPGISISGCSFRGICADNETRDIITTNGGIL